MIFHCEHDTSGILVRKGEPQIATAWHALADLGRREAHRRAAVDRHELGAHLQDTKRYSQVTTLRAGT